MAAQDTIAARIRTAVSQVNNVRLLVDREDDPEHEISKLPCVIFFQDGQTRPLSESLASASVPSAWVTATSLSIHPLMVAFSRYENDDRRGTDDDYLGVLDKVIGGANIWVRDRKVEISIHTKPALEPLLIGCQAFTTQDLGNVEVGLRILVPELSGYTSTLHKCTVPLSLLLSEATLTKILTE